MDDNIRTKIILLSHNETRSALLKLAAVPEIRNIVEVAISLANTQDAITAFVKGPAPAAPRATPTPATQPQQIDGGHQLVSPPLDPPPMTYEDWYSNPSPQRQQQQQQQQQQHIMAPPQPGLTALSTYSYDNIEACETPYERWQRINSSAVSLPLFVHQAEQVAHTEVAGSFPVSPNSDSDHYAYAKRAYYNHAAESHPAVGEDLDLGEEDSEMEAGSGQSTAQVTIHDELQPRILHVCSRDSCKEPFWMPLREDDMESMRICQGHSGEKRTLGAILADHGHNSETAIPAFNAKYGLTGAAARTADEVVWSCCLAKPFPRNLYDPCKKNAGPVKCHISDGPVGV
ncbi:hypothetical protein B0T17DRAFT_652963 [Bombardia bombarda]|uniref:Uncharacterized protein n=1 Tax=Bombardia bombarda TaxID=252184 RepID=A0AA39X8J3_9PEZI|nr:hypothetical protein B0T17DRAFT_652963 [Bombardia bombarda]